MPIFPEIASAFPKKNGALPKNLNISRQTEGLMMLSVEKYNFFNTITSFL